MSKFTTEKITAIGLETVGCCAILAGIIIEVIYGAEVGFITITGGSLLITVGGLLYSKLMRKR